MSDDDLKYRIPYYYASNGRSDALASELSCLDAMCLFNWRLRGMAPEAEKWLFLIDFTLTVKQDESGQVTHVGPLSKVSQTIGDSWPDADGAPDFLEALKPFVPSAPEAALHHIRQVVAERGMAIIACADEKIGIFISSLRSDEQSLESHVGHVFTVLAVDVEEVHYVDTPLYIIKNRYVPHPKHRGIGVMQLNDFLPALAGGYHLLSFSDAPPQGAHTNFPVGLLQKMAQHHQAFSLDPAGCWVGDLAYAKLVESLDGGTNLLEALPGKYVGATRRIDYLDWKCFEMLNMRRSWLRACQERALQMESGSGLLAATLTESVQLWKSLSAAVCVPRDPAPDRERLRLTVRNLFAEARELDGRMFDQVAAGIYY
ncbi:MAG: hypothetical protein JSR53_15720 [Proteobacteria bacterium]|nr:hypothetical protein [Pseudomonadota bacterium]MBS0508825.1 hypothetical protein [Pseudomonadota bacterium]